MVASPEAWVASIRVCSTGEAMPDKACDKDPICKPRSMFRYIKAVVGLRLRARVWYLFKVVTSGTRSCKVAPKS